MITPKERVIRLFLGFLSHYVPLSQARLATLGGYGIEAKIWAESGVPPDHGWLIELNRERGGRLIKSHRYKSHNRLGTFHRILNGYGEDGHVDGFHLDLCGTMSDRVIDDFSPVLPLVLQSTGKCLAITVADQRRNVALEQWPEIQLRGKQLFGRQSTGMLQEIESQQRRIPVKRNLPAFIKAFDPTKAAKREFGLLVEIAEILRNHASWTSAQIERYVYVSRYQGRPFRMRTYFFHFEQGNPKNSGSVFARMWITSPLHFNGGEKFVEIKAPSTVVERTAPTKGTIMSRLGNVARALGGDELAEYEMLVQNNEQLQQILQTVASVNGLGMAPKTAQSSTTPAQKGARRNWDDLSQQEQITWLLKALELKAKGNGSWDNGQWKNILKQDFGHYSAGLGRSLRAALARTNGKFRANFVTRIKSAFGKDFHLYLDRLSKL